MRPHAQSHIYPDAYHRPFVHIALFISVSHLPCPLSFLSELERVNIAKAGLLYAALGRSALFSCPVAEAARSRMNVVFTAKDKVGVGAVA